MSLLFDFHLLGILILQFVLKLEEFNSIQCFLLARSSKALALIADTELNIAESANSKVHLTLQ